MMEEEEESQGVPGIWCPSCGIVQKASDADGGAQSHTDTQPSHVASKCGKCTDWALSLLKMICSCLRSVPAGRSVRRWYICLEKGLLWNHKIAVESLHCRSSRYLFIPKCCIRGMVIMVHLTVTTLICPSPWCISFQKNWFSPFPSYWCNFSHNCCRCHSLVSSPLYPPSTRDCDISTHNIYLSPFLQQWYLFYLLFSVAVIPPWPNTSH